MTKAILQMLRPHQWLKNVIVFVPLAAAHTWHDIGAWVQLGVFFVAFCLGASATYVVNDLWDRESDAQHHEKKLRPLAAGQIPTPTARLVAGSLLLSSLALAACAGAKACLVLAAYEAVSVLYTLFFKRFVVLDIVVLASFYTVRLVGGALVGGAPISPWLGALSQFMFFSLATGKRYSELSNQAEGMAPSNQARGYRLGDMPMLLTAGVSSGLLGVLVLALYVSSENSIRLYARPDFLWALCPLLMLWVCRFWLITNRGEMHEDPVWFALRDRASHWILAAAAVVVVLAGAK